MNHPASEFLRTRLSTALLAVYFALAPSTVPLWRLEPRPPPAAVLPVGAPTPSLAVRPVPDRDRGPGN